MPRPTMRVLIARHLAVAALALLVPMFSARAQAPKPEFNPDHILVRTRGTASRAAVVDVDKRAGAVKTMYTSELVPGLRCVRVAPGGMDAALAVYRADPNVKYAEPDYIALPCAQDTPYGINLVKAPLVWPASRGSGVIVADLDTGIDLAHPDLPAPALTQSFIPGQAVQDFHSHGTHTAGTIVAVDNSIGVVGVAPLATLIVGKVLSNEGPGSYSGIAAGIDWAVANHARVISMSLGGSDYSIALQDSCDAALSAGTLVVASSGNAALLGNPVSYPAGLASVLAVGAVDSNKNIAYFSSYGPHVSLSAPGVNVNSTVVGDGPATWSGVDHAAERLSGSAAGSASGNAVYCGLGDSPAAFPPGVSGQIAHIRRGGPDPDHPITFATKVQNARTAGAIGVIISNNLPGLFSGTLGGPVTIPVVGVSQADGDDLQAHDGTAASICAACVHDYAYFNGTSMACPHVSGVAALLFSLFPNATPQDIRLAMEKTAEDLTAAPGSVGKDHFFGWGLVNAQAAKAWLDSQNTYGGCCTPVGACEFKKRFDCADSFMVDATCLPNPCPQPTGTCCQPDGWCLLSTPSDCAGFWSSAAICSPNVCSENPSGACCISGGCTVVLRNACAGIWISGTLCAPEPCADPKGTCCSSTLACTFVKHSNCAEGSLWTAGGVCFPSPCPQAPGACCSPDGSCTSIVRADCGYVWKIGAVCDTDVCPPPTGACCSGTDCLVRTAAQCSSLSRSYKGDKTVCDPNPCGQACPLISAQPIPLTVCAGQPATLSVSATGVPSPTFQWRKSTLAIEGATSSTLVIPAAALADAGSYDCVAVNLCGSDFSAPVALNVVPAAPTITLQPAPAAVCTGDTATFRVRAPVSGPKTFQWRKGGSPIPGAVSSTLAIPGAGPSDAGAYDCVITNVCGSATSTAAALTIKGVAPSITLQPVSAARCAGQRAVLRVRASGTLPRTFQWRRNSSPIAGATANSFVIPAAGAADAGAYDCVVSNTCGSATSSVATITVSPGFPVITVQPQPASVCENDPATLRVRAPVTGPKTFQWRKDSVPISGATSNILLIPAAALSDAGAYDCVVTNACGSATSQAAPLSVDPCMRATDACAGRAAPSVASPPAVERDPATKAITLRISVKGDSPILYQWRKDGSILADGVSRAGTKISGSATPTLVIRGARAADSGAYACTVSNPCGVALGGPSRVAVCAADLDFSGSATVQDTSEFLAAWFSKLPPADFNASGAVTAQDLFDFLTAYFAGCN